MTLIFTDSYIIFSTILILSQAPDTILRKINNFPAVGGQQGNY